VAVVVVVAVAVLALAVPAVVVAVVVVARGAGGRDGGRLALDLRLVGDVGGVRLAVGQRDRQLTLVDATAAVTAGAGVVVDGVVLDAGAPTTWRIFALWAWCFLACRL
jgi:hypothetical protein